MKSATLAVVFFSASTTSGYAPQSNPEQTGQQMSVTDCATAEERYQQAPKNFKFGKDNLNLGSLLTDVRRCKQIWPNRLSTTGILFATGRGSNLAAFC